MALNKDHYLDHTVAEERFNASVLNPNRELASDILELFKLSGFKNLVRN